jgi:alkyl sulfatase BDS1-like metallo-beta-lactamase superfamily hydrolase
MTSGPQDARKDATATTRAANDALAASLPFEDRRDFEEARQLDGDANALHDFIGLLDTFELWFNIITP